MKIKSSDIKGGISVFALALVVFALPYHALADKTTPIPISSIEYLQKIGAQAAYPLTAHYVLTGDIDASETTNWNDGAGFVPLGGTQAPNTLSGTFDGAGYAITGLRIQRANEDNVGLFRGVASSGKVKNITFREATIEGNGHVGMVAATNKGSITGIRVEGISRIQGNRNCGGIAGNNDDGTINECAVASGVVIGGRGGAQATGTRIGGITGRNTQGGTIGVCSVEGMVAGHDEYIGGIVGENAGRLDDCQMAGELTGKDRTGGIVGHNTGIIKKSHASGNVSGNMAVGGFAGYVSGGLIEHASAKGGVVGSGNDVGGFAGRLDVGTLKQCYSSGAVAGASRVGGFTGIMSDGLIEECYARSPLSRTSAQGVIGGLVGVASGGSIEKSYWDLNVCGTANSDGGIGLFTHQALQQSYYLGWDFTHIWAMQDRYSYPFFQSRPEDEDEGDYDDGQPLSGVITVSSIEEIQRIGHDPRYPMDGHYELAGNIDASATALWDDGKGFNPLGTNHEPNCFSGIFDGAGYVISGLRINRDSDRDIGLFKAVGADGEIKDMAFTDTRVAAENSAYTAVVAAVNRGTVSEVVLDDACRVTGQRYVGSIVGQNHGGHITLCETAALVRGQRYVGGIVGHITGGQVASCESAAQVEGTSTNSNDGRIGGIAGYSSQESRIAHCQSQHKVTGGAVYTGGIAGLNAGRIEYCRSDMKVEGGTSTGGIVGRNEADGIVDNCTNAGNISGTSIVGGFSGVNKGYISLCGVLASVSVEATSDNIAINVGGFVGHNSGRIKMCYAHADVVSGANTHSFCGAGGFVGVNRDGGLIEECFATGNVISSGKNTGGFVGCTWNNSNIIADCFATGNVSGDRWVGGFVGNADSLHSALIINCFSTGNVTGRLNIGGFVGAGGSDITNCYWDMETSGQETSSSGTPLFTWQMQQSAYFENWDFAFVWGIDEGTSYPYLREVRPECIPDETPPVLTLLGGAAITHPCGAPFEDPWVTAMDHCDGDIGDMVAATGVVDIYVLGEYTITYDISDSSGNAAESVERVVTVVNEAPPGIILHGGATIVLECGEAFSDPGAEAHDACEGDLSDAIEVSGEVETNTPGDYTLEYRVSDSLGNTSTKERTITVVDTTPPTLQLLGDTDLQIDFGDSYDEPGWRVTDLCDGDLSDVVTVDGVVDASTLGTYTLVYAVSDREGNRATAERTVRVVDFEAPVITVLGESPMTVECGDTFVDPRATAEDNHDGDITDPISTTGLPDMSIPGTYTVTYHVSDASGNETTATRTIHVVDSLAPTITLTGGMEITVECGVAFEEPGYTAFDACEGDLTDGVIIGGDALDGTVPGVYVIAYEVSDSAGHSVRTTRTVTVADTMPPVLTLSGDSEVIIECGDVYEEPGVAAMDGCDGDVSDNIWLEGHVDANTPGEYLLAYHVSDSAGNESYAERTVSVVDETPPVLILNGALDFRLAWGEDFVEPGWSALDHCDGDLGAFVTVEGEVNTGVLGVYSLEYHVADRAGHTDSALRTVRVLDEQPPSITILGDSPMTVECGDTFVDPGATAEDNHDGDITDQISSTGQPDMTMPGSYAVTYYVSDASGNEATATRIVIVEDTNAPALALTDLDASDAAQEDIHLDEDVATLWTVDCGTEWAAIERGSVTDMCDLSLNWDDVEITVWMLEEGSYEISDNTPLETSFFTTVPGLYRLDYFVEDFEGNATALDGGRYVLVLDNCVEIEGEHEGEGENEGEMPVEGETPEGEPVEGEAPEGEQVEGETQEGEIVEGEGERSVPVIVPDISGMTLSEAEAALAEARLKLGVVDEAYHAGIAIGRIIRQSPAAGSGLILSFL